MEGISFQAGYDLEISPAIEITFGYGLKIETTPENTILLTKYREQIVEVDMGYQDNKVNGCLILFSILKYQIEKRREQNGLDYEERKDL